MSLDFSVLDVLQEQYQRQRGKILYNARKGNDASIIKHNLALTRHMIKAEYHLQYDEKSGKWVKTRKVRQRPLKKNQVVEMWVTRGAQDELCLRYEGEMYNQGQGPYPDRDTHPHCNCRREVVAIPNEKGRLAWAVPKPRNKSKPKLKKIPKDYQEPVNPYDVDNIRAPESVFS